MVANYSAIVVDEIAWLSNTIYVFPGTSGS